MSPVVRCDSPFVDLPVAELIAFCRRWQVDELRLVGSAANGPFTPESDLDFVFFASFRARIYATHGAARADAMSELEALGGRAVDLVCARHLALASHPFALHNLLVRHEFPRHVLLLEHLRHAAELFGEMSAEGVAETKLADPRTRTSIQNAILGLGRACANDDRIAEWKRRGIAAPWEEFRATLAPVLSVAGPQRNSRWPADRALAALMRTFAKHAREIFEEAARTLPEVPTIPPAVVSHALGDAPPARATNEPLPSSNAPTLHLDPDGSTAATPLVALCQRFGIHRLLEGIGGPRTFAALASVGAKLYRGPANISPDAATAFAALGASLVCARTAVLTGNPLLAYNHLVRHAFTEEQIGLWFVREAARAFQERRNDRAQRVALSGLRNAARLLPADVGASWPWKSLEAAEATAAPIEAWSPHVTEMMRAAEPRLGDVEALMPPGLVLEAIGDMAPTDRLAWLESR